MSEAVNFYKEPGEPLDRAAIDLGPYVPAPDDGVLVCRCEEVTKGDIRRAIHDGMYTMTEIRRYLRQGMGLCQGQRHQARASHYGCGACRNTGGGAAGARDLARADASDRNERSWKR